jgi:hypothetical protein
MRTSSTAVPSVARRWRTSCLAAAACLLLFPWLAAPRASLAAAAGQSSMVRLTISVPRTSYPRDALVRVTVRLRNISRVPIVVGSAQAVECEKVGPSAVVLSEQGDQVYPPAPLGGLQGSCGPYGIDDPARLPRLLPGHTMTRHPYVILRGPTIRAIATYYVHTDNSRLQAASKSVSVSLYDAPKPALTLTTSPGLSATIAPVTGAPAAKLRMVYQWLCPDPMGARGTAPMPYWLPAKTNAAGTYTLTPDCPQPYQWHVAAGFPNQPVVYIDYCRPSEWGCD